MLTALLWTTLIASIILLTAIASPIRLSCKAAYKEGPKDKDFSAAACYIHPLIFRMEYSIKDGEFKIFILGFEKRLGGGKEDNGEENINTGNIGTDDIDKEDVYTNDINTDSVDKDSINKDDVNTNDINTDNANTDSVNTDSVNEEKKIPLMSRLKSKINEIKRHKAYKVISNKPLRTKLLRWLKRSSIRVIRAISIEKLKLHVRIGLNDPASLGKIYGYFSAAQSALALQHYRADLSMTPVFTEKRLDLDSELKIKTTLSIILWQLIMIAVTFPYWSVWRVWRIIKSNSLKSKSLNSFSDERAR
jgi:hypothetical protein